MAGNDQNRSERVAAMVDPATRAEIERRRIELERRTGMRPTLSSMTAKLIADGLRYSKGVTKGCDQ